MCGRRPAVDGVSLRSLSRYLRSRRRLQARGRGRFHPSMGVASEEVGADAPRSVRPPMSDMLWGGRVDSGPHPEMLRLTSSMGVDIRLLEQEIGRAHV